jgi:nitrite reductase/ring-hydroxylating ferredoxin subunit
MADSVVVLSARRGRAPAPEPLHPAEWTCAGLAGQIPGEGDLLPVTLGERALHVRREAGGGLSAAFNSLQYGGCGSLPVQCMGGRKIACPIRSCAFSLDGGPVLADDPGSARTARQFTGFSPGRLRRVDVATWGPFILVNTTPEAEEELDARLAELRVAGCSAVPGLRCVDWHTSAAVAPWPEITGRFERRLRAEHPEGAGVSVVTAFENLVLGFAGDRALALVLKPVGPLTAEVTVAVLAPADRARPPAPSDAREAWSAMLGDLRPARPAPGAPVRVRR